MPFSFDDLHLRTESAHLLIYAVSGAKHTIHTQSRHFQINVYATTFSDGNKSAHVNGAMQIRMEAEKQIAKLKAIK